MFFLILKFFFGLAILFSMGYLVGLLINKSPQNSMHRHLKSFKK